MLISEGIAGKRLLKFGLDVVEELKEEKGDLFAMFPIGATM